VPGVHVLVHRIADDHGRQVLQAEDPGRLAGVAPEHEVRPESGGRQKFQKSPVRERLGQHHIAARRGADMQHRVPETTQPRDKDAVVQDENAHGGRTPLDVSVVCTGDGARLPVAPWCGKLRFLPGLRAIPSCEEDHAQCTDEKRPGKGPPPFVALCPGAHPGGNGASAHRHRQLGQRGRTRTHPSQYHR